MNTHNDKGVALITGASSGIGATYAARLAPRGYDLVLVARDAPRLEELAARLRADTGITSEVLRADLTQEADLARVEQRLRSDATITMLVNNAGVAVGGPLVGGDLDRLDAIIALNVVAVTRLASAAATNFAARGAGVLINLSSVLALAPEQFNAVYSGTKAFWILAALHAVEHGAQLDDRLSSDVAGIRSAWNRLRHGMIPSGILISIIP